MSDIYENIFLPLHEARGTRANEVAGGGWITRNRS